MSGQLIVILVFVGGYAAVSVLNARARKNRPAVYTRGRLSKSELDAWTAGANELGLDLEPVYPHRMTGRIGHTQIDATMTDQGVYVLGTNASMPGKFRLVLAPEWLGASVARALGKKDVHIDARGPTADDQSELDARFAISTSSIVLARRILKTTGDRLVPFDRATWTIEDGDVKMNGQIDDLQQIATVIRLVGALADAATAIAENWTRLAGELGGSVDHLAAWTMDGTLPPIAIVRGSESFLLHCDLDEDRLRLTPDRAAPTTEHAKTMTFPMRAAAGAIAAAADAYIVSVSGQEGMAYRG